MEKHTRSRPRSTVAHRKAARNVTMERVLPPERGMLMATRGEWVLRP